jgi:hypothetical protein
VLKALGYDLDGVSGPADRRGALAARPAPDHRPDGGGEITSEQIEEIVRRSIRDELKRRGIGDPDED